MRIVFAGGGSGGHIYPSIAVARRARELGWEILFIVTPDGLENQILKENGFPTREIPAVKLVRGNLLKIVPSLWAGVNAARAILREFKPDVIFSTGGYVAFPAVVAGWREGIRSLIHEPNTVPGRANLILSLIADGIVTSYPETRRRFLRSGRCLELGTPIRYSFDSTRVQPREKKTLLVLGGSQGAHSLNKAMWQIYPTLSSFEHLRVIHVTGRRDYEQIRASIEPSKLPNIEILPYAHDMEGLLYQTDFAVSRAGAVTIAEFVEFGVPAIFIPHEPSVGDHQRKNAQVLVDAHASDILMIKDVTPDSLLKAIMSFLSGDKLDRYKQSLRTLRRPGATDRVLSVLKFLADRGEGTDLTREDPSLIQQLSVEDSLEKSTRTP